LNPRQIHEIYVDYVDEHLSTKHLRGPHIDIFYVNLHINIHIESISVFQE